MANFPDVRVAPCNRRGRPGGSDQPAVAALVTGAEADAARRRCWRDVSPSCTAGSCRWPTGCCTGPRLLPADAGRRADALGRLTATAAGLPVRRRASVEATHRRRPGPGVPSVTLEGAPLVSHPHPELGPPPRLPKGGAARGRARRARRGRPQHDRLRVRRPAADRRLRRAVPRGDPARRRRDPAGLHLDPGPARQDRRDRADPRPRGPHRRRAVPAARASATSRSSAPSSPWRSSPPS